MICESAPVPDIKTTQETIFLLRLNYCIKTLHLQLLHGNKFLMEHLLLEIVLHYLSKFCNTRYIPYFLHSGSLKRPVILHVPQ